MQGLLDGQHGVVRTLRHVEPGESKRHPSKAYCVRFCFARSAWKAIGMPSGSRGRPVRPGAGWMDRRSRPSIPARHLALERRTVGSGAGNPLSCIKRMNMSSRGLSVVPPEVEWNSRSGRITPTPRRPRLATRRTKASISAMLRIPERRPRRQRSLDEPLARCAKVDDGPGRIGEGDAVLPHAVLRNEVERLVHAVLSSGAPCAIVGRQRGTPGVRR